MSKYEQDRNAAAQAYATGPGLECQSVDSLNGVVNFTTKMVYDSSLEPAFKAGADWAYECFQHIELDQKGTLVGLQEALELEKAGTDYYQELRLKKNARIKELKLLAESYRAKLAELDPLVDTLKSAPNEGTDSPYWLLIDPSAVVDYLKWEDGDEKTQFADLDEENCERIAEYIPNCITGPFFSRTDADAYLKARRYEYSKDAYVYCHSGYWSQKYKGFYKSITKETREALGEVKDE